MNNYFLRYTFFGIPFAFLVFFTCSSPKENSDKLPESMPEDPQGQQLDTAHGKRTFEAPVEQGSVVAEKKEDTIIENIKEKPQTNKNDNLVAALAQDSLPTKKSTALPGTDVAASKMETSKESKTDIVREPVDRHDPWDRLLQKYVTAAGQVNYTGLKAKKHTIDSYIQSLTSAPPITDQSRDETLAYWINLYNALTVNLVVEHYPLKQITDINNGKPWDLSLIEIEGKSLSLNDIEHGIIRKRFNEPRIHFAVNCAAKSCPKLLNSAYSPAALEKQLSEQSRYFIQNTNKNKISKDGSQLSRIFEWYQKDFGSLSQFIGRYHPEFNPNVPISYLEYNWDLNE